MRLNVNAAVLFLSILGCDSSLLRSSSPAPQKELSQLQDWYDANLPGFGRIITENDRSKYRISDDEVDDWFAELSTPGVRRGFTPAFKKDSPIGLLHSAECNNDSHDKNPDILLNNAFAAMQEMGDDWLELRTNKKDTIWEKANALDFILTLAVITGVRRPIGSAYTPVQIEIREKLIERKEAFRRLTAFYEPHPDLNRLFKRLGVLLRLEGDFSL